jgi:hypothetical protein
VSRSETVQSVCVLLEEYSGSEVEEIADQLLSMLAFLGEDLLDRLGPPPGLQHWLLSHGLSLVATQEATPPKIWEALQEEEAEEAEILEEGAGAAGPPLQVGDYVEYQTAAVGPRGHSNIGAGRIKQIYPAEVGGSVVIVDNGSGQDIWLDDAMDFIRPRLPG